MLRFGIVGTGRISDWVMVGAAQDPRIKVTAVCSRSIDNAEAFIRRHDIAAGAKAYTSVAEMAADPCVDAIYIGTPNQTHCDYTLTCLAAGKHVLCEKPLAVNADEGRRMADAARESGCLLMEAMVSTLNPNFRLVADRIGEVAPVRHYTSSFCQYSSKYEALKKGIVASAFHPLYAGALRDIGIYTLYPMVSLFGKPESVHADVTTFPTPEGPVDVHGSLSFKYPGMTASLVYSKVCDSFVPTEIAGEKGNLLIDEVHIARATRMIPHAAPSSGQGPKAKGETLSEGLPCNEYFYEFKEFADVLESGRRESSVNSLETSLTVLEIIDQVLTGR